MVANVQRFGMGVPQRDTAAHRNGDGPHVLEQLQDDGHNALASSSQGLAWWSHCAPCLAPSAKQVRDYVATGSSHPSGACAQVPVDGVKFQPPPAKPAQKMGSGWPLPGISRNLIMTSCAKFWRPFDSRQLGGRGQHSHTWVTPGQHMDHLGVVVQPAWPTREWALKRKGMAICWVPCNGLPVLHGLTADVGHLLSMPVTRLRLDAPQNKHL